MIGIAVVGYGYWGPNLVRNFWEVPGARLVSVCDLRTERLAGVQTRYPAVEITTNFDDVLNDPRVDAVAIATPVSSHFDLAMRALQAGQARLRRKADRGDRRTGAAAGRRGRARGGWCSRSITRSSTPAPSGRCASSSKNGARRRLLLRLGAREPRSVPARRQRDVGSCRPRSVDHGLRAAGQAGGRVGDRRQPRRRRAGEHRLPESVLREQPDRAHPRQLAGAGEGPPDARRRQPAR